MYKSYLVHKSCLTWQVLFLLFNIWQAQGCFRMNKCTHFHKASNPTGCSILCGGVFKKPAVAKTRSTRVLSLPMVCTQFAFSQGLELSFYLISQTVVFLGTRLDPSAKNYFENVALNSIVTLPDHSKQVNINLPFKSTCFCVFPDWKL